MTISNECDNIIKGLEVKYTLRVVKVMFDENTLYLGGNVIVWNVNKSCGVDQELYPFMSADDYVGMVLPIFEEFYGLYLSLTGLRSPQAYS